MSDAAVRTTVDLSAYPDLVVIYLGMRVEEPRGAASVEQQPDGLLLHEQLIYSQDPLHVGMRRYWRDFDAPRPTTGPMPAARDRANADRAAAAAPGCEDR